MSALTKIAVAMFLPLSATWSAESAIQRSLTGIFADFSKLTSLEVKYDRKIQRLEGSQWKDERTASSRLILTTTNARLETSIKKDGKIESKQLVVFRDGKCDMLSLPNGVMQQRMQGFHIELPMTWSWISSYRAKQAKYDRSQGSVPNLTYFTPPNDAWISTAFADQEQDPTMVGKPGLQKVKTKPGPGGRLQTEFVSWDPVFKRNITTTFTVAGNGKYWPESIDAIVEGTNSGETVTFSDETVGQKFKLPKSTVSLTPDMRIEESITAIKINESYENDIFEIDPSLATSLFDGKKIVPIKP